jgi:prepilin-type processing-associated H-X9-DG protein
MAVSVTNGGAMESVETGDVVRCIFVMSNELSTPKILICPADTARTSATNFTDDLNSSHISYFVGVDADEAYPQRIMSGDDNFALGGVPVKSGLFTFATNAPLVWGPGRHGDGPRHFWTTPPTHFVGNIGYADGSVAEVSDAGLQQALFQSALATNRLAIP